MRLPFVLLAGLCLAVPATAADRFTVFLMPDTQNYVADPVRAAVLEGAAEWICQNQHDLVDWTGEPAPIAAVLHLGDVVADGDDPVQWQRADAVFRILDDCPNGTPPYLVITGNHDYAVAADYATDASNFDAWFGSQRYAPYRCTTTPCAPDRWFLGAGPDIPANSRLCQPDSGCPGGDGPEQAAEGRARAILFPTPDGRRVLALGNEAGSDLTDVAWLQSQIDAHPGVPTIVTQHALLSAEGDWSSGNRFGGEVSAFDLRELLLGPNPQVMFAVGGHYRVAVANGGSGAAEAQSLAKYDSAGGRLLAMVRNYQAVNAAAPTDGWGEGWNALAVFEVAPASIRVRSVRIGDTGDGSPGILEYDQGLPEYEATFAWHRLGMCEDGEDNDGDGSVDWNGAGLGAADPDCNGRPDRGEAGACGLGAELFLLAAPLARLRRRRRA